MVDRLRFTYQSYAIEQTSPGIYTVRDEMGRVIATRLSWSQVEEAVKSGDTGEEMGFPGMEDYYEEPASPYEKPFKDSVIAGIVDPKGVRNIL